MTSASSDTGDVYIRIKPYIIIISIVWTVVVCASLAWNFRQGSQEILSMARNQARVAHNRDVVYRRWNAKHGGVYVPITEETSPNLYLEVANRDIADTSGRPLTLVNPAYMTRQVHELAEEAYGIYGHITSLTPIRPENAPDAWETQALRAFEKGEMELSSVESIHGEPHMRLMRPLITEKGCMKCHAVQGYKVGDSRAWPASAGPSSVRSSGKAATDRGPDRNQSCAVGTRF